ncbi:hypothetical protein DL96DRAFT_1813994 [Flagelloscypha sp. PMI_526]|nr:hypothetical protein DL96DRAFT_1813994 [Flagelloscypha sp. PMI_526]
MEAPSIMERVLDYKTSTSMTYEKAVSDAVLPQELLEALIAEADAIDLIIKLSMAAVTILVWDWILTLDLEIRLVWPNKWSFGKILFLLNRYLPFADILVGIVFSLTVDGGTESQVCAKFFACITWLEVIGILVVQVILILRTWALYGRNKWVLAVLLSLLAGTVTVCCVMDQGLLSSTVWAGPTLFGVSGCTVIRADNLRGRLAGNYLAIMAFESVVLLFLIIRVVKVRKAFAGSHLMQIIYRDGIMFYLFLFLVSIVNVVTVFMVHQAYCTVLVLFQRAMHSVAAGRILLDIRQVASRSHVYVASDGRSRRYAEATWGSQNLPLSPLQFASYPPTSPRKIDVPDGVAEWFGEEDIEQEQ